MRKKDFLGFTLVELLVVFGISILLFTFGVANFSRINRRQIFNQQLRSLLEEMRLAQSKAIVMEKPSDCEDTTTLEGYRLVITANDQVQINVTCGVDHQIKLINLVNNVEITHPGSSEYPYEIDFPVLSQEIRLPDEPGDPSSVDIEFQLTGCTQCRGGITVATSGLMYLTD